MDENDSLSEYNKIPFGHNRTNGAVYSKMYFKVEIYTACFFFFFGMEEFYSYKEKTLQKRQSRETKYNTTTTKIDIP